MAARSKKKAELDKLQEQFEKQIAENDRSRSNTRTTDDDRSILSQTLNSIPSLGTFRRITLRPSMNFDKKQGNKSGVRDFWSWGTTQQTTSSQQKSQNTSAQYDFSTDSFQRDRSQLDSLDLSSSLIINDDLSKAEIEKMEIRKKIHDLNKILKVPLKRRGAARKASMRNSASTECESK